MSCKKCLKYGHTVNKCRESTATCAGCTHQGHKKKLSAPVPKPNATSAKQTTKSSHGSAKISKEKQKSSRSKQKNAYSDYRPYESFSDGVRILN